MMSNDIIDSVKNHSGSDNSDMYRNLKKSSEDFLPAETKHISSNGVVTIHEDKVLEKTVEINTETTKRKQSLQTPFVSFSAKNSLVSGENEIGCSGDFTTPMDSNLREMTTTTTTTTTSNFNNTQKSSNVNVLAAVEKNNDCFVTGNNYGDGRNCYGDSDNNLAPCPFSPSGGSNARNSEDKGPVLLSEVEGILPSPVAFKSDMKCDCGESVFSCDNPCEQRVGRNFSQEPSQSSIRSENCSPTCGFQRSLNPLSTRPISEHSLSCCKSKKFFSTQSAATTTIDDKALLQRQSHFVSSRGSAVVHQADGKKDFFRDGEQRKLGLQRCEDKQIIESRGTFSTCEETPWSAILSFNTCGHVTDVDTGHFAGGRSAGEVIHNVRKQVDNLCVTSRRGSAQLSLHYAGLKDSFNKGVCFPRCATFSIRSCSLASSERQPSRKYGASVEKQEDNNGDFLITSLDENLSNIDLETEEEFKKRAKKRTIAPQLGSRRVSISHSNRLFQSENGNDCCGVSTFAGTRNLQVNQGSSLAGEEHSVNYNVLQGPCVAVGINEADMDEEGNSGNPCTYKQWLKEPLLFYLVFNLIKLHEAQEHEKNCYDDSVLDPSTSQRSRGFLNNSFFSSDLSVNSICNRLSRAFLELKNVYLKPYFMRWSDENLRGTVLSVMNAWETRGPLSQEFSEASLRLLNEVSVDRKAEVKQTLFYRLWKFVGGREQAQRICIFILFLAASATTCIQCIFFAADAHEQMLFILGLLLIIIVLFFSALSLLLLHHNAATEEMCEYGRFQMFGHISEAMRCVRRQNNNNNINITNNGNRNKRDVNVPFCNFAEDDEHFLHLCKKKAVANSFEGNSFLKNSSVKTAPTTMCIKDDTSFLKDAQLLETLASGLRGEGKHNANAECVQLVTDDKNNVCKDNVYSERRRSDERSFFSGKLENSKDQVVMLQSREVGSWSDIQRVDGLQSGRSVMQRDNILIDEDCCNASIVGFVSFGQEQPFEDSKKIVLLQKGVGHSLSGFTRIDSRRPSLFLESINNQCECVHLTGCNSHCCLATSADFQQHANLDPISPAAHCASCDIDNCNQRHMLSVSSSCSSLLPQELCENFLSGGFDGFVITALVYFRSATTVEGFFSKLWNYNILVLQRDKLGALDAAFQSSCERFNVFLLHAPDLDANQLELALSWLLNEGRAVFFFSSLPGLMPSEIPHAYRLELPLTTAGIEAILLAGIGVTKKLDLMEFSCSKPFKVPQYRLGKRLGGGTFGNVFEAEMEATGARCAVKRIYLRGGGGDFDCTDGTVRQLEEIASEVEIMSSLNHPNIVQYFFCGRDDNCVSIFMELCSGGSLGELIARGELRFADKIKEVLRDIITAVVYLHGKRVVHCDLKPDNVLFSEGRAKVTDFGAAVCKRDELTNVKGTFAYMAPEVLLGETYGSACDVWSIGCIAAQVLSVSLSQHDLGLAEVCEKYGQMSLEETLDFDCDEPIVREFLQLCLLRDPNKRCSAEGLLQHAMLKDDNVAVHQWLLTCAGRKRAQQLSRTGKSIDAGVSLSFKDVRSPSSLSAISLRSTELHSTCITQQQTSVSLVKP